MSICAFNASVIYEMKYAYILNDFDFTSGFGLRGCLTCKLTTL